MSCKCGKCGGEDEQMYMYRNKRGKAAFTGFVQNKAGDITWIGKNEKSFRPIKTEADSQFFLDEMKQYDR